MMQHYEVMVLLDLRFALPTHQDEILRLGNSRPTFGSAQHGRMLCRVVSIPCMHELGSYGGGGGVDTPSNLADIAALKDSDQTF